MSRPPPLASGLPPEASDGAGMRHSAPALRRLLAALAALALISVVVATAQGRPGQDQPTPPPVTLPPPLSPPPPESSPPPSSQSSGGCRSASQPGVDAQGAAADAPNPLAGLNFYVG